MKFMTSAMNFMASTSWLHGFSHEVDVMNFMASALKFMLELSDPVY